MTEHRRSTDQPESRRDRRTIFIVAIIAAVAVACAFAATGIALWLNAGATRQIQDGRRAGNRIICAANAAVIEAGRSVITGHTASQPATPPPPKVESTLRSLGYPPFAERQRQAEKAGEIYGRQIAVAIERVTNEKDIVKPDGTLDCKRLAAATGIK